MKKNCLAFASAFLLAGSGYTALAEGYDPQKRDIEILTQWFEGQFDNEEQVWFQNHPGSATPEEGRHGKVHMLHRRLDLPEFGDHVFYVEEYVDDDVTKIVRQRIVTFASDPASKSIRMKQGFLKDAQGAVGGYFDPGKLSSLTRADVFFMEDLEPTAQCDVFWTRVASQFEGKMPDKGCVFGEGDKRRYSVHNMILSEDKYWRIDATYLLSDNSFHAGSPGGRYHKMSRALPFLCSGRIFSNPDSTFDDGTTSIQTFGNKRLHSQGGTFTITRDSDGQTFEVLMRTKEYPFYNTRPDFLYFSLRKAGEQRSMAFSVNDTNSRVVGITLPGFSASCHRIGYDFRQKLEILSEVD